MSDGVVGEKIVGLRKMTKAEMRREGWEGTNEIPMVIVLENGSLLYPSRDEEGNGPGSLFGYVNGKTIAYY